MSERDPTTASAAIDLPSLSAELLGALDAAQTEGLEPNVRRWLRFQGATQGEWIEAQALVVPDGKWTSNKFAHAGDAATLVKLLAQADTWNAPGIYVIANRIDPAVATRKPAGSWHVASKGEGTSDRDVRARAVFYIDIDVERPKGTSATDAQVLAAHERAVRVYAHLAELLGGRASLAFGHSGNGRALFIALDFPRETPEFRALVGGLLAALRALHQGDGIKIDVSVAEAKRLVPAWGTMKRKGAANLAAYPHRRTAILTPAKVVRVGQPALAQLLEALRQQLDDAQRADVDKAMGKKAARASKAGPRPTEGPTPFDHAKEVPIDDVLAWLDLLNGADPICPGCGLSGDSSVAIVGNGLKCSHDRCAAKGVPGAPGFRTTIDVVMEARDVDAKEAVALMAERFGFEGLRARRTTRTERKRPRPPARAAAPQNVADVAPEVDDAFDAPPGKSPVDELVDRLKLLPKEKRSGSAITDADIAMAIGLAEGEFIDLCEGLKAIGVQIGPFRERARRAQEQRDKENAPARAGAPEWEERLIDDKNGDLMHVVANAITILRNDINWRGVLAWDEFQQQIVFRREPCWYEDDAPSPGSAPNYLEDAGQTRIAAWLMRRYTLKLEEAQVYRAARTVAQANTFHSLREWLDGLTWDGQPRLSTWLSTYLGAANTAFARFAGRAFLISAIARAFRPGVQADYMLILEGDQDHGKSSALRVLFGEFFSESPLDLNSKDRFTNLRGVWCQSFDELASFARTDINTVKTFISSPVDTYRPPYGAHPVRVERQCVFAGTVNPQDGVGYFKDPTGNRRYWPVKCGSVQPIDRVALAENRDQLWAEAVHFFRAGEKWHPATDEERALCRGEQGEREETSPWEQGVGCWLSGKAQRCPTCRGVGAFGNNPCLPCHGSGNLPGRSPGGFVTQSEVLDTVLAIPRERWPLHATKVASVLMKLGWRSGKRRLHNGVKITPYYPPDVPIVDTPNGDGDPGAAAEVPLADPWDT